MTRWTKQGCAFCDKTADLTGEHLFADWIDRLLTKSTTHYVFTYISREGTRRRWISRHLNRKFKAVCNECNNGWMSDIDNAARDALKDVIQHAAPMSFLDRGTEAIAAFTTKNALVTDSVHPKPFGASLRNNDRSRQERICGSVELKRNRTKAMASRSPDMARRKW